VQHLDFSRCSVAAASGSIDDVGAHQWSNDRWSVQTIGAKALLEGGNCSAPSTTTTIHFFDSQILRKQSSDRPKAMARNATPLDAKPREQ